MKKRMITAAALTLAAIVFCIAVLTVDRAAIGPQGTAVGFSHVNKAVFDGIGVNVFWYKLTQALGILALAVGAAFAILGLCQLIKGRSLKAVDGRIWLLGGLYAVLAAVYVFFEKAVVNYRPVIMQGSDSVEASFPSSQTVLICVIAASAFIMLGYYIRNKKLAKLLRAVCAVIIAAAVVGRLLSGVHWFTDIFGGILISAALVAWFYALLPITDYKGEHIYDLKRR